jgi:endonuclease/exonuclease/phosphatase (EEP) superfamily protein YafD
MKLLLSLLVLSSVALNTQASTLSDEETIPLPNNVLKSFGRPVQKALNNHHLKILVWNLYKGSEDTFGAEFLFLSFDRDLILTQEVYLDEKMFDIFKFLPHMHFMTATSFFSGKDKIRTGVGTISTVKPIQAQYVRTDTLEPFTNTPKMSLITKYPIKNSHENFNVVNIHGINFVTNKSFEIELKNLEVELKKITGPIIFAGDFNTWNKERLAMLDVLARKIGLQEAIFSTDYRKTWNGNYLDHFYFSKNIKVLSARSEKTYKGSDHQPLQLEIEYYPQLIPEHLRSL